MGLNIVLYQGEIIVAPTKKKNNYGKMQILKLVTILENGIKKQVLVWEPH